MDYRDRIAADRAETQLLAYSLDESTTLSWLWALLFGPIYFAVHRHWPQAIFTLILAPALLLGFLLSPFLVYPAWASRARHEAEKGFMLDRLRNRLPNTAMAAEGS